MEMVSHSGVSQMQKHLGPNCSVTFDSAHLSRLPLGLFPSFQPSRTLLHPTKITRSSINCLLWRSAVPCSRRLGNSELKSAPLCFLFFVFKAFKSLTVSSRGSQRILTELQVFINQERTPAPLALCCRVAQFSAAAAAGAPLMYLANNNLPKLCRTPSFLDRFFTIST